MFINLMVVELELSIVLVWKGAPLRPIRVQVRFWFFNLQPTLTSLQHFG